MAKQEYNSLPNYPRYIFPRTISSSVGPPEGPNSSVNHPCLFREGMEENKKDQMHSSRSAHNEMNTYKDQSNNKSDPVVSIHRSY